MQDVTPIIERHLPAIRALRRELHQHPEIGFQEFETSKRVADRLAALPGFSLRTGVAKTGVVATVGGEKPGPCVALRADMDCLPMTEETGLPYASKRPGFMHACGHDGHTSALLGAALVLHEIRDELRGPVKFLFQPAEEGMAGARSMCEEGALESPRVDAVFGLHNWPTSDLEFGQVALRSGGFMGGSCEFFIKVSGRGGHAAMPHLTIDPIYVGSQIVGALQSLASRTVSPVETLVLTVTKFHAGHAMNVIPETAELAGTIRSLSPELMKTIPARMKDLAEKTAAAFGAQAEVELHPNYPVTVNDPRAADYCAAIAREIVGPGAVRANHLPTLGSEDFSFYLQRRPGAFFFVGTRPPAQPAIPQLHQTKFDFNDEILPLAMRLHVELARQFPQRWSSFGGTASN